MSSERVNSVDMRVKRLAQEATNLKTSQNTGWDNIRSYRIQTTNEYDYSWTPVFSGGQIEANMAVFVKFIADHQEAPYAVCTAKILVDNQDVFRVGHFSEDTQNTKDFGVDTNGWVADSYGNYSPTLTPNKINELSFYNNITVNKEKNIKVKFRIWGTDTGRMIVRVEHNAFKGIILE